MLREWSAGNQAAENELFSVVMPDLRRVARHIMSGERKGHTLQPTELVNQIYVRLVAARSQDWQNRQHFFAMAARAMRRYLIDHARARPEVRFTAVAVDDLLPAASQHLHTAVTLDSLLDQLAEVEPELCQIVEVKYFLGLNDEEASDALGIPLRTFQRRWHDARRWLFERLERDDGRRAAS